MILKVFGSDLCDWTWKKRLIRSSTTVPPAQTDYSSNNSSHGIQLEGNNTLSVSLSFDVFLSLSLKCTECWEHRWFQETFCFCQRITTTISLNWVRSSRIPFPSLSSSSIRPDVKYAQPTLIGLFEVHAWRPLFYTFLGVHVEALSEIVHTLSPLPKAYSFCDGSRQPLSAPGAVVRLRPPSPSLWVTSNNFLPCSCPAVWTGLLLFSQAAGAWWNTNGYRLSSLSEELGR